MKYNDMTLGIQTAQAVVKMAKQTLKQVGETMFPGISESYIHNKPKFSSLPISKLGNEIVTDLPLQICLFFNLCYFPFWLIISIIIAYVKVLYDFKICNEQIKLEPFGFLPEHQSTKIHRKLCHFLNILINDSTAWQFWLLHCTVIGWKVCMQVDEWNFSCAPVHRNAAQRREENKMA